MSGRAAVTVTGLLTFLFSSCLFGQSGNIRITGNAASTAHWQNYNPRIPPNLIWSDFCLYADEDPNKNDGLFLCQFAPANKLVENGGEIRPKPFVSIAVDISELTDSTIDAIHLDTNVRVTPAAGKIDISYGADQTLIMPIQVEIGSDYGRHSALVTSHNIFHEGIFQGLGLYQCSRAHVFLNSHIVFECLGSFIFYESDKLRYRSVRSELISYLRNPVLKALCVTLFNTNTRNNKFPIDKLNFSDVFSEGRFPRRRNTFSQLIGSGNNSGRSNDENSGCSMAANPDK
jgi:hypothetical protein